MSVVGQVNENIKTHFEGLRKKLCVNYPFCDSSIFIKWNSLTEPEFLLQFTLRNELPIYNYSTGQPKKLSFKQG